MGLIGKILTAPVAGPVSGLLFIAETIAKQVDEQQEKMSPQARLMELESHLMMGDITADEYKEQEEQILKELDEQLEQAGE